MAVFLLSVMTLISGYFGSALNNVDLRYLSKQTVSNVPGSWLRLCKVSGVLLPWGHIMRSVM